MNNPPRDIRPFMMRYVGYVGSIPMFYWTFTESGRRLEFLSWGVLLFAANWLGNKWLATYIDNKRKGQ